MEYNEVTHVCTHTHTWQMRKMPRVREASDISLTLWPRTGLGRPGTGDRALRPGVGRAAETQEDAEGSGTERCVSCPSVMP